MDEIIAVLLIAHGSRRAEANDDLARLAEILLAKQLYPIVQTSFLELAEPGISAGAEKCVAAGASCVKMLPYFLSAGAHVTEDLERHRRELAERFPQVVFELCPPLGLHPLMIDIVIERLREGGICPGVNAFTNAGADLAASGTNVIEGSGQAMHPRS